ncbi:MAG TPA: trypsin-like peptidase domain-containing protein [Candidatus Sulfotelmatobacter sp.]|nr:trypsin-like peptidase domain-containing protein [Candidatus Sulfotelmatobacter sp.]
MANVHNVPLVVSQEGTGSSVVIKVSPNGQALLVTNNHVVKQSFERNGHPVVLLLFYDAALKDEYFDSQKFFACWASSPDQSAWCQAVRKSSRVANVLSTDPARDLALVGVDNVPAGVTAIPVGDIANLGPGDSVAIIGNPEDLLWSLTTGIISAVRKNFPIGTGSGTVIQTQAPVNPGNSGGPLMELDGKLAGVVFATAIGASADLPSAEGTRQLVVPAPGLNYAIGVDQVLAFTASVRQ